MRTSEEIGELATALAAAQGEFAPVVKSADNPFFRSKYADLASIVEAIAPVTSAHGLSITQMPEWDHEVDLLTTRLMHTSGQWIETTMRIRMAKDDAQGQGSAITYARRYAFSAALGVVTEVDDDGNAASNGHAPVGASKAPPPVRRSPPVRPTANQPAAETGELADEATLIRLRQAVEALSAGDRAGMVQAWKASGLGSLRADAGPKTLLASDVEEAQSLITMAPTF
ncbi:MAG: ERF family protein [Candidatus Dormibacteraceae bacterium]